MKTGLVLSFFAVSLLIGWAFSNSTNVITVDGYEHAVVICGSSVTINYGHHNDPEIALLLEKAEKECE